MGKRVLVTGAATSFGRGVAFGLARGGHEVVAGCEIWPQVWELRNAAKAENIAMEVIKLDILNEIDRTNALGFEIDLSRARLHAGAVCSLSGRRATSR